MNAILPTYPASEYCKTLIQDLNDSDLGQKLMLKGHGRMFGILVCTDGTVYKAFSGALEGSYLKNDFVPPVFDVEEMNSLLDKYDRLIKDSDNHRQLSNEGWIQIKKMYRFNCYDGQIRSLSTIFSDAVAGTGDCCAPRLLSYAYKNNKKPQSLCEFFYGDGSFEHLSFNNPCDSRCKPILPSITGLDILYQDSDIVVINKPSGMLSIEGRGEDKQDCIASRVRAFFPNCIQQPCIHRLDQATSGLLVLGLTKKAHDTLSLDFENHKVYKEYLALVDGLILQDSGIIELPMRLDTDNRPHQIVDFDKGKAAITNWEKIKIENHNGRKCTRLRLIPKTGRTHQLRVHCAYGLGCPILGDTLYGNEESQHFPRLMLQANILEFTHPVSGEKMHFELKKEF